MSREIIVAKEPAAGVSGGDSSAPGLWLTAYPWNLMERGLEEVLDRLRGEVGAAGLSVWAATPRVKQMRIREVQPRLFRTEGGIFFQVVGGGRSDSACRPLVSTWTRTANPLREISEHCDRAALRLRAILSLATMGKLALRYPEFACRNAYGDESGAAVCLVNPIVQECMLGLVTDLTTNYPLSALVVADCFVAWQEAFFHELTLTSPLGETERAVLSTCFCDACVKVSEDARVDVREARRRVATIIDRALRGASPHAGSLESLLTEHPALAEHRRVQTEILNGLLRRVAETSRVEVLLARSTACPPTTGVDLRIPAGLLTRAAHGAQLADAFSPVARRNELWVSAPWIVRGGGQEFVADMSRAAQSGFAGLDIDNFGLLPDEAFTTVKQAIRFARRTAGS